MKVRSRRAASPSWASPSASRSELEGELEEARRDFERRARVAPRGTIQVDLEALGYTGDGR